MKEGGKVVKLGEVASYINGYAFKPSDWHDKGVPIIRIQNLTETKSHYNYCKRKDIPYKYRVAKGDLLISWSATLGVFEWNETEAWLNQHIFKVVFDKIKINKYYFKYAVEASIGVMVKRTNGAIMKHIRKGDFDNIEIPLPPLPEQHRIVKKLDAAFEKIDAMKAKAEKNIENAKALFQQTLAAELEPKEGWVEKKLGEIGIGKMSYGSATSSKEYDGSTRYVRITDIDDDGNLQHEKKSPLFYTEKYILEDGDLLFARTGATVGKTYLYKSTDGRCLYAGYLIRLKVNTRIMNPIYLFYCTKTNRYKDFIRISQKAAAQPNINAEIYSNYLVSFPQDKDIQQQIVTKLDILSAKCKKLEEAERKTIAECDALKQAILRQAFNGEL